jgi:hypothetical protein
MWEMTELLPGGHSQAGEEEEGQSQQKPGRCYTVGLEEEGGWGHKARNAGGL